MLVDDFSACIFPNLLKGPLCHQNSSPKRCIWKRSCIHIRFIFCNSPCTAALSHHHRHSHCSSRSGPNSPTSRKVTLTLRETVRSVSPVGRAVRHSESSDGEHKNTNAKITDVSTGSEVCLYLLFIQHVIFHFMILIMIILGGRGGVCDCSRRLLFIFTAAHRMRRGRKRETGTPQ